MAFHLGEVWKNTTGRRAVVTGVGADGLIAELFFDNGEYESFGWTELTAMGEWAVDGSPRPRRSAEELRALVTEKICQNAVCPEGVGVLIRDVGGGNWDADSVSPNPPVLYADCAKYIGKVAHCFGLLFALR